jgi:hypothetical protein
MYPSLIDRSIETTTRDARTSGAASDARRHDRPVFTKCNARNLKYQLALMSPPCHFSTEHRRSRVVGDAAQDGLAERTNYTELKRKSSDWRH